MINSFNGIVNVLKPSGLTSNDVIYRLRRIYAQRGVGHFGTLDPLGAGVLLCGVGSGARLFNYFLNKSKTYYAVFKFGIETDTLDSEGAITAVSEVIPSESQIKDALKKMHGTFNQIPPQYSAKSVGGVRAYKLARQGESVVLAGREVQIYSAELVRRLDDQSFAFLFRVSGGTYIRSIARDLAAMLNTVAVMTQIIRTETGKHTIDEAYTLESLAERREEALIPTYEAIDLPRADLPLEQHKKISNGLAVECELANGDYKLFCGGEFFGIAEALNSRIKTKLWLREGL